MNLTIKPVTTRAGTRTAPVGSQVIDKIRLRLLNVLLEVGNRGRKALLSFYNRAQRSADPSAEEHFGDGFLMKEGFILLLGARPPFAELGYYADPVRYFGSYASGKVSHDLLTQ